ncbi:hypothetical protein JXL19_08915 [bacterium]|nr:hypothetical protein [bacterium]
MKQKEIEKKLSKIYKEISRWPMINKRLNYSITTEEIERREAILCLKQILYKIEDAKKEKDKNKEFFNLALYYLTKASIL